MPTQEAFEHWISVGEILGFVALGFASVWLKAYHENRRGERGKSSDLVQRSVGAAFIDVTTASAIRQIAHNTGELLKIAQRWQAGEDRHDVIDGVLKELDARKRAPP